MKNIFIINGSKEFGGSDGKLNDHMTDIARRHLTEKGMNVRVTRIDDGYDDEQEVLNYLWADVIIYQMPAWWMEGPWIVKKYMLSVTWNAPQEAFEDEKQFFEGRGIDSVYFPLHKTNQFTGMTSLPTFSCFDVVKNPHIDADICRYLAHLDVNIAG